MHFRIQFHSYRPQIQVNGGDFLCPRHWFLIVTEMIVTVESSSRQVNWEFQLTITS